MIVSRLFILLIVFNLFSAKGQQLRPPVTNFTPKEYGTKQTPENYCIFQDSRGFIIAGNSGGVLIFDGTKWEFVEVEPGNFVTAIEQDENGTIYIGTRNGEFGKLIVEKNGKLKFLSLRKNFEKNSIALGWVQRIFCVGKLVYLYSPNSIYLIEDKKITNVDPNASFQLLFKCDGKIYARERQVGLIQLIGKTKKIIAQNIELRNYGILGLTKYDNNQLLIITQEKGLWLYNNKNKKTICLSADSVELKKHQIFGGIKLHDGNFALNTLNSGLLIINSSGKIISTINKASGIRVNDVKQVIQDKQHNLWLALSNGIGLVNYGSFLHIYDDETGLLGGIECVFKHKNNLYVGTSEGLFTEKLNDPEKHFTQIYSVNSQVWDITTNNEFIYVATNNGIYKGNGTEFVQINSQLTNSLVFVQNNQQLLAAGTESIFLIDTKTNKIISENYFDNPLSRSLSLTVDPSNKDKNINIWMGSVGQGIFKIQLRNDSLMHTVYQNLEDRALAYTRPVIIDNKIYFCTAAGLRKLILDEDGKEYFDTESILPGMDTTALSDLLQTGNRIWVCAENKISHFNDNKKQITTPFLPIDMGRINNLFAENETTCWIAAADGLVKYNEYYDKNYNQQFEVVLRKILINNDSLFFAGNWQHKGIFTNTQPPGNKIQLAYTYNNYEFIFSAIYFEAIDKIEFSHFLEGHEAEWSTFSTDNKIKFTNLREGTYTLHVKAKNVYGFESKEFKFTFTILPPWYRTITAYIIYAILAITIFIFINRLLSYRLKQKNIQLEEVVKKRTQEINEQYIEIRHQKQEITDSINYAQKIQEAMMPFAKELKRDISDSFILFKPKDIVSGDFYWYGKYENKMVIICADCTGHGVPGAFMSMLCIDKLNQIIPEKKVLMPDKILGEANKGIKKSLGQADEQNLKTKDGMDAAVVTLDLANNKLYYAGANRSLWKVRNNEIIEYKADKCAVGGFTPEEKVYTLHEITIQKDDCIYMSTDGYADQFGGPKGKKIMVRTLKEIILENHKEPMNKQSMLLNKFVEDWKKHPDGVNSEHEQVDDICLIGFRI